MSFLDELLKQRTLKNVDTVITNKDGSKYKVNINSSGNSDNNNNDHSNISSNDVEQLSPSYGYIVDTKPDDLCYKCDLNQYNDQAQLFIGSQDAAFNRKQLDLHGIKRILNVGYGIPNLFLNDGIEYLNLEILDDIDYNIVDHFKPAFEFINKAIECNSGLLIHCNAGISRSSTILIAFLMQRLHIDLQTSMTIVKKARSQIKPNQGFMKQLANFETIVIKKLSI